MQYIISANIHRRHMTRAQRAMALALMAPEPDQRGRGKNSKILLGLEGDERNAMRVAICKARLVLAVKPLLAPEVLSGMLGLRAPDGRMEPAFHGGSRVVLGAGGFMVMQVWCRPIRYVLAPMRRPERLYDLRPYRGLWRLGLALVTASALNTPASAASVQPFCHAHSKEALKVHVLIEWSYHEKPEEKHRTLWHIDCAIKNGECYGASLNLDVLERGEPIALLDFVSVAPGSMRLVAALGHVYTITWGTFVTLVVDLGQKKVMFRESSERWDGVGEGTCAQ